jgi:hypothetical protein
MLISQKAEKSDRELWKSYRFEIIGRHTEIVRPYGFAEIDCLHRSDYQRNLSWSEQFVNH